MDAIRIIALLAISLSVFYFFVSIRNSPIEKDSEVVFGQHPTTGLVIYMGVVSAIFAAISFACIAGLFSN